MTFIENIFLIYLVLSFLAYFTGDDVYYCNYYYIIDGKDFWCSVTLNVPKTTKSHAVYSILREYIKKEHPNSTEILILSLNKI